MKFNYSQISAINYEQYGSGDVAVIFLHGFGASLHTWDYFKSYLVKEKFTSYLVDLKGHGYSSFDINDAYSVTEQSKMIFAFIRHTGLRKVILIGHSYGGGIALATVLEKEQHPDFIIAGLILIDAAAFVDKIPYFIQILKNPIKGWLTRLFISPRARAKVILNSLYYNKSLLRDEIVNNYSKFYSRKHWDTLVKIAREVIPVNYDEIIEGYPTIQMPVLIIWGEKDPIFPVSIGRKLNATISNSKLNVIENTGHIPNEEQPLKVYPLISEFIKNC